MAGPTVGDDDIITRQSPELAPEPIVAVEKRVSGRPQSEDGVQVGGGLPTNDEHERHQEEEDQVGESRLLIRSEITRFYENFQALGRELHIRVRPPPDNRNAIEWLNGAFTELHSLLLTGFHMTDYIGVSFQSGSFTKGPAGMSVRRVENFFVEDLVGLVTSVTQSATEFRLDDSFIIKVNVINATDQPN